MTTTRHLGSVLVLQMLGTCLLGLSAVATEVSASFLPEAAPFDGYEVRIPMRDGNHLAGDVYIPKGGGTFPVILVQTPYNKAMLRTAFAGASGPVRGPLFSDTHYAFVCTDWRDRFASKDAASPDVVAGSGLDGYDVIEWIVQQDWCDGKVGTWGPSALGAVQYRTLQQSPPNLVCSVPIVMPLNLDYEIYYPGGVLWEEFARTLGRIGWDVYNQLTSHPVHDNYWDTVGRANFIEAKELDRPMLITGGWYDIYVDAVIDTFYAIHKDGGERARRYSRVIIGPWLHRVDQVKNGDLEYPGAALYGNQQAQRFFDRWLRGQDARFTYDGPLFTYYQMGADEWRHTDVWPPKGTKEVAYYLQPGKGLSTAKPQGESDASTYTFDPSDPAPTIGGHVLSPNLNAGPRDQREKVEGRDDVLAFSTPVLEEDLTVAGKIKVKLYVSTDRPDTDFTAILTDVYPDGRSISVTEGIRRLRFRNGYTKEELATPGEVYAITIELSSTALTFLKGHRVRVLLSSSNHPKYAVNLNDGGAMYEEREGQAATNSIHHSGQHPSALILPVSQE